MKQSLKTIGVLQFLLLYSIVIVLNSGFSKTVDTKEHGFGSDKGNYESSFSIDEISDRLYHTNQNENFSGLINITPVPAINNNIDLIFNSSAKEQQIHIATYTAYEFIASKLLLRLRQTDIIFPFHYFW